MDEEEKIQLLKNLSIITPSGANNLVSSCIEQAESVRQQVMLMQRTISLLPLMTSPSFPTGLIPPRESLVPLIMKPDILPPQDATPTFIQHSALLISYLHTKHEVFAKAVIKRYATPDFHFIIYSVVPAIFGFFTSFEHIQIATNFYADVIKIAPPHMAISILQPFFCSLATFKYVEAVMSSFLKLFGAETRLDDPKRQKALIDHFATELANHLLTYACLIPNQVLAIFKIMAAIKWKLYDFVDLFFRHFFTHQALAWVASSPYSSRVHVFNLVIKKMLKDDVVLRNIYKKLSTVKSTFDVPACYKVFEQPYLHIIISAADITTAAKCFELQEKLPYTLKDANYDMFNINVRFRPYWVRIFPKGLSRPTETDIPIIFKKFERFTLPPQLDYERPYRQLEATLPSDHKTVYEYLQSDSHDFAAQLACRNMSSDPGFKSFVIDASLNSLFTKATAFENMLTFTMHLRIIQDWYSLCLGQQTALMTPIALKAARTALSGSPTLAKAFSRASRHFQSRPLRQLQFMVVVEASIKEAEERLSGPVSAITAGCSRIISDLKTQLDPGTINELPPSSQYMFWESVERLRALPSVPLVRQFEHITDTMLIVKLLARSANTNHVMQAIVVLSECVRLPVLYLLFNAIIMKNPQFEAIETESQIVSWNSFESFILWFLSNDRDILEMLVEANQDLDDRCGAVRKEFAVNPLSDSDSSNSGTWALIQQQLLIQRKQ